MSPELSLMAWKFLERPTRDRKVSPIITPDAPGIVVEHDRQVRGPVDRQRMDRVLALGRQRVGRRGHQQRIGADLPGVLGVGNRVLGPRRARADDQRRPALDDLLRQGSERMALFDRLSVIFAGRSSDNDAMDAGPDQTFEDGDEGLAVDLAVRRERCDGRGVDALELHFSDPIRSGSRRKYPALVRPQA